MNNLWSFAEKEVELTSPYEYLFKYASQLKEDTNGIIEGIVTESISNNKEEIVYALYLVVPELKNNSYRLIEVKQASAINPYPVNMKLYGKASIVEKNEIAFKEFEKTLIEFITSPLTKLILTSLKTHLDIKKQYEMQNY